MLNRRESNRGENWIAAQACPRYAASQQVAIAIAATECRRGKLLLGSGFVLLGVVAALLFAALLAALLAFFLLRRVLGERHGNRPEHQGHAEHQGRHLLHVCASPLG